MSAYPRWINDPGVPDEIIDDYAERFVYDRDEDDDTDARLWGEAEDRRTSGGGA